MAGIQGIIEFGGVVGIDEGSFLLIRGVKPGRGQVSTRVLDQVVPEISDLVFAYGDVTMVLTGCAASEARVDVNGEPRLVIYLEDRRWAWAQTEIIGRYNVRESQDEEEGTVKYGKTPQELVGLIAAVLGETIDATALPNDARPYVDWRNTPGDEALAEVIYALGCEIVPNLFYAGGEDSRWIIVKVGVGDALPGDATIEHAGAGVTVPKTPERIRAIGGDVRYDVRFTTEPVALDTDYKWKPVDDVSYKPAGGWYDAEVQVDDESLGTHFDPATGEDVHNSVLANTVWRAFRINGVVGGGGPNNLDPPGFEEYVDDPEADPPVEGPPHITEIGQLLPLLPVLNETYVDAEGHRKPRRPYVYGSWFADLNSTDDERLDAHGNIVNGRMFDGFSIDLDAGIVVFARPMVRKNADDDYAPANIRIRAVCNADWVGLNKKIYYALSRDKEGVDDPERVLSIHRPEVILKYREKLDGAGVVTTSNKSKVDDELGYYLDAFEGSFTNQIAATASYRDLLVVNLDGAVEQIEWTIDGDGTKTRVSRNTQLYPYLASYAEAKRRERLDKAAELSKLIAEAKPAELFGAG